MIAGPGRSRSRRGVIAAVACAVGLLGAAILLAPVMMFAGGGVLSMTSTACSAGAGGGDDRSTAATDADPAPGDDAATQPAASASAQDSIPATYLSLFRTIGAQYQVPWVVLAGIGEVESDDGRSTLPGVHSGANAYGAAGPMQIGIGGAAGDQWGGAAVHPASEQVSGVATDANGDGVASVYEPADAIAGAAKYLLAHGVLGNVSQAIFAYNHLDSYVQAVLHWAGVYASGGYAVSGAATASAPECLVAASKTSSAAVAMAISYAQQQLGKPYLWGGTGPDAFDCSGLVMMAYRAAGLDIPRTSQQQWAWGPRVSPDQVQPGDLVFFAGSDGTPTSPGHVGLVIGNGLMIEAYAVGFPIRIAPYGDRDPVGFTRPLAHAPAASAGAL